jgi:hypothetical protein
MLQSQQADTDVVHFLGMANMFLDSTSVGLEVEISPTIKLDKRRIQLLKEGYLLKSRASETGTSIISVNKTSLGQVPANKAIYSNLLNDDRFISFTTRLSFYFRQHIVTVSYLYITRNDSKAQGKFEYQKKDFLEYLDKLHFN